MWEQQLKLVDRGDMEQRTKASAPSTQLGKIDIYSISETRRISGVLEILEKDHLLMTLLINVSNMATSLSVIQQGWKAFKMQFKLIKMPQAEW